MNRRTLLKTVAAAPLACLVLWRKAKAELLSYNVDCGTRIGG
jgi:hypothetical protein